jgi:hypothetical protein
MWNSKSEVKRVTFDYPLRLTEFLSVKITSTSSFKCFHIENEESLSGERVQNLRSLIEKAFPHLESLTLGVGCCNSGPYKTQALM